ncbi:MAG: AraC family transcriptional regulator, partial [Chloroflexota bacterium]
MTYSEESMAEFVALLDKHAPSDEPHPTDIPGVFTLRQTKPYDKEVMVYEPAILILGQGKKHCILDGKAYDYSAGRFLCLFLPIPVQAKAIEVSPGNPLL